MPSWTVCCPFIPKPLDLPGAVGCIQGLHTMDTKLLDILACPLCKGPLKLTDDKSELICKADGMAFPVRDGIPVMLESEARTLDVDERLDK
jgi:uncharacterized protein YbaR (Trm112 family)